MEVLGVPNEEDLSFVTDTTALNYLKEFQPQSKGVNFYDRFPYANKDAVDLVRKMVQFNPFFRPNIEECLMHPYLSKVRKIH